MKRSKIDLSLMLYVIFAMTFIAFGAVSWALGKPYKTDSAIAATAVMVGSACIIAFAGWFSISKLMVLLRFFGYGVMVIAALASLNFLIFAAWGQTAIYPAYSAWVIAVAITFLYTQPVRLLAEEEVRMAEGEKLEARSNSVSANSSPA